MSAAPSVAPREATAPYKGLAPYTEDDSEWFFGRDEQVRIVATNLMSARITILYGESGVGKTSLLRAGVVPALRAEAARDTAATERIDFAVALHNRWHGDMAPNLIRTIEAATRTHRRDPLGDAAAAAHLDAALHDTTTAIDADLLLILDQFEEWFLYHRDRGDPAASELVRGLSRTDLPVHYLLSLREDALAQLDRFKGYVPGLFDNLLRLHHLDQRGARQAIEAPLSRYNAEHPDEQVQIEAALVDGVLDQVRTGAVTVGDPGQGTTRGNGHDRASTRIEAPFLQLVMTRLWDEERASGSKCLRLETLERLGRADRIVRTHLDDTMAAVDSQGQTLAAHVFNHLVTPSGTKIAHSAADLAEYTHHPIPELEGLLDDLSRRRILRPVRPFETASGGHPDGQDAPRYEIFHDVLAAPVLDWRRRHEVAERATRLEREREHAQQEAARERRRARIFRALTVGLVILLILTVAATVIAIDQRQAQHRAEVRALREAVVARSEALQARAGVEFPVAPTAGMALAVAAEKLNPGSVRRGFIESSLSPGASSAHGGYTLPQALLSPNGSRVVVVGPGGVASLWSARTGHRIGSLHTATPVASAAFSPNGAIVATPDLGGHVSLWGAANGRLRRTLGGKPFGPFLTVAFSPDSRWVLAAGPTDSGSIWNVRTGTAPMNWQQASSLPSVVSVAYGSTDRLFVTVSRDNGAEFDMLGQLGRNQGGSGTGLLHCSGRGRNLTCLNNPYQGTVSSNGRWLVTLYTPALAEIWNLNPKLTRNSDQWQATLRGDTAPLTAAAFSPNTRRVITASLDGRARIWDARTGEQLVVLKGHHGPVLDAAFDRTGRLAVTAGADGTVRVWRASTGAPVRVIHVTTSSVVTSAEFNPSGTAILTVTVDGRCQLWSLRSGRLLFTF